MNDAQVETANKYKFEKAFDGRGRQVPGLWVRNNRWYGCLRMPGQGSRRYPLFRQDKQPVSNLTEAKEAFRLLGGAKLEGGVQARRTTAFTEFAATYISWLRGMNSKNPLTIDKEESALKELSKSFAALPISQIARKHINSHVMRRKQEGMSNRTLNLDIIALGNCLRYAKEEGQLFGTLVTADWTPLEHKAPKRSLCTVEDLDRLLAEAVRQVDGVLVYENGLMLSDYLRLMATSGARRDSALFIKWDDVDFGRKQLRLEKNKYSKANLIVDFNPTLEKLLVEMKARRNESSPWLFPSAQDPQEHCKSLRDAFERARKAVGLDSFVYHDCRHFFISNCIMSGIDTMTISKWVGHTDGGVLIGKVYGHLTESHTSKQASKVTFGAAQEKKPEAAPAATIDLTKVTPADLAALLAAIQKPQTPAA